MAWRHLGCTGNPHGCRHKDGAPVRHKLSQRPAPQTAVPGCGQAVAGERRGDLLGLNLAPVPADRGQPSSACKFVLVGLANHAGPDGTGAFPSVATLVRYTGLSERTVRTCLDRLPARASSPVIGAATPRGRRARPCYERPCSDPALPPRFVQGLPRSYGRRPIGCPARRRLG
jgi:hypothetical protein